MSSAKDHPEEVPLEPGEVSDDGWWTVADACRALGWDDQRVNRHRDAPFTAKERPAGQRPRWLLWGPDIRAYAQDNPGSLGPTAVLSSDPLGQVVLTNGVRESATNASHPPDLQGTETDDKNASTYTAALQATVDVLFDALVDAAATAADVAKRHHDALVAVRRVFRSLDAAGTAKVDAEELNKLLKGTPGS